MRSLALVVLTACIAFQIAVFVMLLDQPRDFASFYASGLAAGAELDPFGTHPLTHEAPVDGVMTSFPNLNPPPSLLLFEPLALLSLSAATHLWRGLSLLAYLAAVGLLAVRYERGPVFAAWALALSPFWDTLTFGQVYTVIAALAGGGWLLLERRPWAAGVLIGLAAALKPNFMVWPVLLLLAGHWRPSISAAGAIAAVSGATVLRYGLTVYDQWLSLIVSVSWTNLPANASLIGVADRVGAPWLGAVVSVLLLAAVALWALVYRPNRLSVSTVALAASLLASPLAWPPALLVLLPIIAHTGGRTMAATMSAQTLLFLFGQPLRSDFYTIALLLALAAGLGLTRYVDREFFRSRSHGAGPRRLPDLSTGVSALQPK